MAKAMYRLTGARDHNLIAGPGPGLDTAIVRLPGGRVLVASTDPISFIPSLGPRRSAWLSVHGTASDIATCGVGPRYATFDLNLPPSMRDRVLRQFWLAIHETCRQVGIAIIGGHTGRFQGCDYTVVGGVTMFTIADETAYVTSAMGQNRDELIATKGAAIEAGAILSLSFPRTLKRAIGERAVERAQSLFTKISVVNDALSAAKTGLGESGVRAMHDVTEGGVLSAAMELAEASGLTVQVDSESIPVLEEVRQVCKFFRIDPLYSLGQGCLLIASKPNRTQDIIAGLRKKGIDSEVIGRLTRHRQHHVTRGGKTRHLRYPKSDPYWRAYSNAVTRGLN
jgi:hydrogenase expression/formation protein HypE